MSWTDHALFWHVYPLGFTGAPIREGDHSPAHRLGHLQAWLPYAVELGTNGLLLGPIFASATHGYDTLDHYRIDPRLGDDADFDALVADARARGVRIVLDGVFNHVGEHHPAFQQALAQGPHSHDAGLFRIDWSSGTPRAQVFEGHGGLPVLNHDNPAVVDWVADVMLHWMRRGVDGWRLDAAYAVRPEFWREVVARVRAEFPEAWIVGEVIHGDYAGYVAASGIDSVTQYELWKATWSGLADANFFELAHALERHNGFLDTFTPQTFVGNHDVNRIATVVGDDLAALATVVLLTTGGVPSIYYGDEQGYRGAKRDGWGGDDEVRPLFPADPSELSGFGARAHHVHQELIGLRRRHPWLQHARTEKVSLTNRAFAYDAVGRHGQRLRVSLSLDPTPRASVSGEGDHWEFVA